MVLHRRFILSEHIVRFFLFNIKQKRKTMSNIQTFTGDGNTTSFYFTFAFFDANDINVSLNDVAQTLDDVTVYPTQTSGDAPDIPYTGGRIDFALAPANGTTIKVWRKIDITRHIDYQPTEQPLAHQLNQDINQCIEILKEQSETLTNVLGLANIPNVADLLAEVSEIRDQLDDFLTADDLTDINTAIEDIPTKANKDMDNLSATGIGTISGYCLPDYGNAVELGASPYTAPSNGFIAINNYGTNPGLQVSVNNVQICNSSVANSGSAVSCFIPVSSGDIVTYGGNGTTYWKYFIPSKNQ